MKLLKDITFVYCDTAEKNMYQPIAREAEKRGYKVSFTENPLKPCEIGFYIEHVNFPQYSKFSVIMLHDITQSYRRWPDIWDLEPWDKYDIGFLPSEQWIRNWVSVSDKYYTRPRKGVYKAGWAKADLLAGVDREQYKLDFYKKYGLNIDKKTVLYAPAWENDGKQDDFVQAMLKLDVNILIKQADVEKINPVMADCIQQMNELHKNIERVTILPPKTNIFKAILASDILVSEESSTMAEAEMMGIPAVSVSNWLIPDVVPSRYPACDYDFVFMTTKEQLSEFVQSILDNYEDYQEKVYIYRDKTFSNIGKTSSIIMDVIDDCVEGKTVRYAKVEPKALVRLPLAKKARHCLRELHCEMAGNYSKKYKVIGIPWELARKLKRMILEKRKTRGNI